MIIFSGTNVAPVKAFASIEVSTPIIAIPMMIQKTENNRPIIPKGALSPYLGEKKYAI